MVIIDRSMGARAFLTKHSMEHYKAHHPYQSFPKRFRFSKQRAGIAEEAERAALTLTPNPNPNPNPNLTLTLALTRTLTLILTLTLTLTLTRWSGRRSSARRGGATSCGARGGTPRTPTRATRSPRSA